MYSTSLLVGRFELLFGSLGSLSGFLKVIFLDEESLRSAPNSLKLKFCYHAVGDRKYTLTHTLTTHSLAHSRAQHTTHSLAHSRTQHTTHSLAHSRAQRQEVLNSTYSYLMVW